MIWGQGGGEMGWHGWGVCVGGEVSADNKHAFALSVH